MLHVVSRENAVTRETANAGGFRKHLRKDGGVRFVRVSGYVVEFGDRPARLEIVQPVDSLAPLDEDLTERARHEESIQQAQKMEAVGRLASGIAHDFNNLLTIILGYCSLLNAELLRGSESGLGSLEEIQKAASRAAALTGQILAFSRKQPARSRVVDPNHAIRGIESMLRRLISGNIRLNLMLSQDTGRISVDVHQLEHALVNLAANARDAMPLGGTLTIEACNLHVGPNFAELQSLTPGEYVQISFTDTGVGMDRMTRGRLFEPFFTTKESGRGTGLGLAMVKNFADQSGGAISVQSEPGWGACFKIYLPRADSPVEMEVEDAATRVPGANAVVLVVEDEAEIRQLISEELCSAGYQVLTADCAEQAIEVSDRFAGRIHLLLADVLLPSMSGPALAEILTRKRPETRVLFASGYSDQALQQNGELEEGMPFLQKPFNTKTLLHRIDDLIAPGLVTRSASG